MNPINNTALTNEVLAKINTRANAVAKQGNDLGQEEFLSLMIAQVKNQDPFQPTQNGDFIAQMAQFATVDGINNMQSSLANLSTSLNSSQTLAASDLIGRSVLAPAQSQPLGASGNISGVIDPIPGATSFVLNIFDSSGALVARRSINPQAEGNTPFVWNGLNDLGQQMAPGEYRLEAQAKVDGENLAAQTRVSQRIESVTLGASIDDLTLNLANGSRVAFSTVQEIL